MPGQDSVNTCRVEYPSDGAQPYTIALLRLSSTPIAVKPRQTPECKLFTQIIVQKNGLRLLILARKSACKDFKVIFERKIGRAVQYVPSWTRHVTWLQSNVEWTGCFSAGTQTKG